MMKKTAAILLAAAAGLCMLTGCQDARTEEKSGVTVQEQDSSSYISALKECFNASYTIGGGEVFYAYMYPDAVLDALRADGNYDALISTFNEGQKKRLENSTDNFTFGNVTDSHEINETQTVAAKSYLKSISEMYLPSLTEDQLDIKEGYEVTFNTLNNGVSQGSETVLVVRLNDEGWKVITG